MTTTLTINLFNGDAAAGAHREHVGKLTQEGMLICRDVLSVGPLDSEFEVDTWSRMRAAFWTEVLDGDDFDGPVSFGANSRDLYANLMELASAHEIRVWAGMALSDQVLLAFVAHFAQRLDIEDRVTVVQLSDSQRLVRGLGSAPAEMLSEHPSAMTLEAEQISYSSEVWKAVCASTPERLIALMHEPSTALPLMRAALDVLPSRYPDVRTGLSGWDQRLLAAVANGGSTEISAARVIGDVMSAEISNEDSLALDTVGDSWLYYRLRSLGRSSLAQPLVEANSLTAPMRAANYRLSEAGRAVLDAERNAIELNGIDDWVGGVHVTSDSGDIWMHEDGALVQRSI